MKRSVKKNYLFNIAYQLLLIITPLITTPYISRTIGVNGIGAISYTYSIISYLLLIGNLGITAYASRQIAYYQNDRKKQSELFSEIVSIKLLIMIPSILILIGITLFAKEYNILFLIQSGYLISSAVTIDWLYTGNEDFPTTVARNFVVKFLSIILIFVLVKSPKDIYIYTCILTGSNLLGIVSLWFNKQKYVDKIRLSFKNCRQHIRGGIALFLVQIAGSVYLYLDKTMIGLLSNNIAENGYYEQSQKIVRLSITLITSLSTVMLPRIASAFKDNDKESINRYMNNSMKFTFFMGVPMMAGLMAISSNLVPWFLGDEFEKCIILLKIFAPVILFNSIYNIIGYQYLLAIKKEKLVTMIVSVGAICNLILNFILIPIGGSIGASIASLTAEVIVAIIMFMYVKNKIAFDGLCKYAFKCILASGIMYIILKTISLKIYAGILETFILLIIGVIIYFVTLLIIKEDYIIQILKNTFWNRIKGTK